MRTKKLDKPDSLAVSMEDEFIALLRLVPANKMNETIEALKGVESQNMLQIK